MSCYSELRVNSFFVGSEKDELIPSIMTLYLETEKHVAKVSPKDLKLNPRYLNDDLIDEILESEEETQIQYICPVYVAIDRLELMGFTKKVAKESFNEGLAAEITRIKTWQSQYKLSETGENPYQEKLNVLNDLTFEKWFKNLKEIVRKNLKRGAFWGPECSQYSPILRYMLCSPADFAFGFPSYDYRPFLRILLDLFKPNEDLVYDLTGFAVTDWIGEIEDLIENADYLTSWGYSYPGKIIVLTEGITDKRFLERSLFLLYPHLADYFRFLDFEGVRVGGGAGELVKIVKAFIGAGIINRIVAFFDNDTAASIAIESLSQIKLPKNIAIFKYPDIKLAESYPAIGPSGVVKMNVNGLAGSIELYLGEEILRDNNGNLIPIQWKGYESKLKKYQGEILKKDEIQKKFTQKIESCESDPNQISNYDWSGIKKILDSLLKAFREHDAKEILEEILFINNKLSP